MKKIVRLCVVAAVLALAVAAFFVVRYLMKEEPKEAGREAVSQTAVKDIEGVTYSSNSTNGEEISLIREKGIWYYEKDRDFPLDQDFVTNVMVATAAEATANRTIDNPEEDLSQYGLDQPAVTITLKKITGDEVKMSIGSYNESVEGYYLKVEGDNKIYLVDGQMVFLFDADIYKIADKEDYPLVEEGSFMHVSVQNDSITVEFKGEVEEDAQEYVTGGKYLEKEKTWKISKEGSSYQKGNQKNIQELISQLSTLKYSKMIAYHADEQTKETYGLGDRAVILTVDYQVLDETTARQVEVANGIKEIVCDTIDKQYVLLIGDMVPEDGYSDPEYYVCLKDSEGVYTINADSLENIVHINAKNYEEQ